MSQQSAKIKQRYVQLGSKGKHELYPKVEEEDQDLPFTYDNLSVVATKMAYEEECKVLGIPYHWDNGGISIQLDEEEWTDISYG